ncbi:MAG: osmoprotectant transporter permease, partial [Bryobacteraceae bacterium]
GGRADARVVSIVLCFFFSGLSDGSVSSFNGLLWLGLLAGVGVVVGGSLFLRRAGKLKSGLLLNLLALPALGFGLFFLS